MEWCRGLSIGRGGGGPQRTRLMLPGQGLAKLGGEALAQWMDSFNDGWWQALLQQLHVHRRTAAMAKSSCQGGGEGAGASFDACVLEEMGRLPALVVPPIVVTMSHFLPRQELQPEKRFLVFPNLVGACMSAWRSDPRVGRCMHACVHG